MQEKLNIPNLFQFEKLQFDLMSVASGCLIIFSISNISFSEKLNLNKDNVL